MVLLDFGTHRLRVYEFRSPRVLTYWGKAAGHPKCRSSREGPAWDEALGSERNQEFEFWQKNIKENTFRSTQVTISLLEVMLGPVKPLHPVHDLQVDLRLIKMDPNDFSWPKHWVYHKKTSIMYVQKCRLYNNNTALVLCDVTSVWNYVAMTPRGGGLVT